MRLILAALFFACLFSGTISIAVQSSVDLACTGKSDSARSTKDPALLVIAVPSHIAGREGRDWLRKSWWNFEPETTIKFFTIGNVTGSPREKEIMREVEEFGDVVILHDVDDGYYSLSRKVLKTIAYASANFPGAFLLKTDDDSWIHVPNLLSHLRKSPHERFYEGFLKTDAEVETEGRWAEKKWPSYFGKYFLPYMFGGGYILSYDLVNYIAMAEPLLRVYTSEDVTIGAALANLDITATTSYDYKTYIVPYTGCIGWPLVDHKVPGEAMVDMYWNFMKYGNACHNVTAPEKL